ncbi:MAG: anthrone oxygenase family protein [Pseudomonadota bacterium]
MQTNISAHANELVSPLAQKAAEVSTSSLLSLGSGIIALVATAAVAGFFYAYSSSVMFGLNATAPDVALRAMQAINAEVRNSIFAMGFFGSAVFLLAAMAIMFIKSEPGAALWFGAAAVVYIGGGFILTMAVNVPMNEALAIVDVSALPDPATTWANYEAPWTFWNHVRTGFSLLSVVFAGIGLWSLR